MKVAELFSAQKHPVFEQIGGVGPLSVLRNFDCLIPRLLEVKRRQANEKIVMDEKEDQKNTKDEKHAKKSGDD